jgi:hypothetical protein
METNEQQSPRLLSQPRSQKVLYGHDKVSEVQTQTPRNIPELIQETEVAAPETDAQGRSQQAALKGTYPRSKSSSFHLNIETLGGVDDFVR